MVAVILLISALAGCSNNNDPNGPGRPGVGGPGGSTVEAPEFVFVPEFITLPDGFDSIHNLVYADGRLYFTAWIQTEDFMHANKLFTMDLDGTNIRQLENFTTAQPPEGVYGSTHINGINVDGDGNLWVAESGNFWNYNLPDDFDGEDWERWEYRNDMGSVMLIRKLDSTGAEILVVDAGDLGGPNEQFWLRAFTIDGDGNIYITGESMMGGSSVHVLDNNGVRQFSLEPDGWINQLVRLPDGTVATAGWGQRGGMALRPIDFASRSWGENIELPMNAHNIFPGGGDYFLMFSDGIGLMGIEEESGESVRLINWIDSDMQTDGLGNIVMLPDGRVICTVQTWGRGFDGTSTFELIILTKVPFDSLPPRTLMSLATFGLDWNLRSAIVNFNRTSTTHRIVVTDYMEFSTQDDWMAGLTRLTTEIIAGRIPDILAINMQLPFEQYVARGLLLDLYYFIDNDPVLSRTDFIENIFRVAEIDGGLYQVFPTFMIQTMAGHRAVVGSEPGWTMEEFRAVLDANPQADMPLGFGFDKNRLLSLALMMSMDDFVDWAAGRTNFDSDEFIQLLEFANTFPDEFDWELLMEEWVDQAELIATGRQLLQQSWLSDFRGIQWMNASFGGEMVFKGFPSADRNGHVLQIGSGLAITSRASDPQGAWNFVRTTLTAEWQRENITWGLPTNQTVFNELLEEAMTPDYFIDEYGEKIRIPRGGMHVFTQAAVAPRGGGGRVISGPGMGGDFINFYEVTQEEADMMLHLINTVSGTFTHNPALLEIINEGAEDFFAGRRSAQDAARVIQSRASIFIAEQS